MGRYDDVFEAVGDLLRCKMCSKMLKKQKDHGTSGLLSHLRSTHRECLEEIQKKDALPKDKTPSRKRAFACSLLPLFAQNDLSIFPQNSQQSHSFEGLLNNWTPIGEPKSLKEDVQYPPWIIKKSELLSHSLGEAEMASSMLKQKIMDQKKLELESTSREEMRSYAQEFEGLSDKWEKSIDLLLQQVKHFVDTVQTELSPAIENSEIPNKIPKLEPQTVEQEGVYYSLDRIETQQQEDRSEYKDISSEQMLNYLATSAE